MSALPIPSQLGSIEAYVAYAHQIPLLTAQEEQSLAEKFLNDGDAQAAKKLVLSHLRFVIYSVRPYVNFGFSQADLIQEGTIGLMKAVKRFDPSKGVRLVSFAIYWIKSQVHEFILKNWRIVKVATTKAQRKLFFNLHKFIRAGYHVSAQEMDHIAETLDVPIQEVATMVKRLSSSDQSFDMVVDSNQDGGDLHQVIPDTTSHVAQLEADDQQAKRNHQIKQALKQLGPREKDIIRKRWMQSKKATFAELAKTYGISIERVRQIEKKAMLRLKDSLKDVRDAKAY